MRVRRNAPESRWAKGGGALERDGRDEFGLENAQRAEEERKK